MGTLFDGRKRRTNVHWSQDCRTLSHGCSTGATVHDLLPHPRLVRRVSTAVITNIVLDAWLDDFEFSEESQV